MVGGCGLNVLTLIVRFLKSLISVAEEIPLPKDYLMVLVLHFRY